MNIVAVISQETLTEKKRIFIRGFSYFGFLLSAFFISNNIPFSGYIDSDKSKTDKVDYYGYRCFSPDCAVSDSIVFCTIQNTKYIKEIEQEICKKNIRYVFLSLSDILESSKDIDDLTCLTIMFRQILGYDLNMTSPKTFNEKMQWLKLHDRKPEYTDLVDKYEVKKIVADKIGEEYIIPSLGVWKHFEDIDFDKLPDTFVLKCTHDSGSVVICRNKRTFDYKNAKEKLESELKINYFYTCREWPYKNVEPRIIAEHYMKDGDSPNLNVYKIFNFNGKPYLIQTITNDKTSDETIDYFDTEWNRMEMRQNFPNSSSVPEKPQNLTLMVDLAKRLSSGFAFLRTDFYVVNGHVYFSEFTFYSDAGFAYFDPPEWDMKLGNMIDFSSIIQ